MGQAINQTSVITLKCIMTVLIKGSKIPKITCSLML